MRQKGTLSNKSIAQNEKKGNPEPAIERALEAELDTHLGYAKHERKGKTSSHARNGHRQKTRHVGIGPDGDGRAS
jgi:transposase-like protein